MPMQTITATELRGDIYKILDRVLSTGIPIEIERKGQKLKITPTHPTNKLQNLVLRPEFIRGNPKDLVHINWEGEINLDLP